MKIAAAYLFVLLFSFPASAAIQVTHPGRQDLPVPLRFVPPALQLPATRVGDVSAPVAVTVVNTSSKPVVLDSAQLFGAQASEFAVQSSTPLPLVLAPAGSTSLEVRFVPSAPGPHMAQLGLVQVPKALQPPKAVLGATAFGAIGAEVLIDAGGPAHLATNGEIWLADYGYTTPGELIATPGATIQNTTEPELYRSARAAANLHWQWDLPNGGYRVVLHFAELQFNAPGARVFDVNVEGELLRKDYDIFATKGKFAADRIEALLMVEDGRLDIDLSGQGGQALLCAAEVRSVGFLTTQPAAVDLGVVPVGQVAFQDVVLTNSGPLPMLVSHMLFDMQAGSAADFSVELGGVVFNGSNVNVSYSIDLPLAPSQSATARVWFAPGAHSFNEFDLELTGTLPTYRLAVSGAAGAGGDPYLHPVIDMDAQVVDYDGSGSEQVLLDGTGSHTHEPGKHLSAWKWSEGTTPLASGAIASVPFALGHHTVVHEIQDDNVPAHTLSTDAHVAVVPVNAVPGALGLYHLPPAGQTAAALLDSLPAHADFAEFLRAMTVIEQNGIGESGFTGNVLVRVLANVQVVTEGTYTFVVTGSGGKRLFVDGVLVQAPIFLAAGSHSLEARWAVTSTTELPLQVLSNLGGGAVAPLHPGLLTHNQLAVPPVINSMPTEGIALGGNQIVLEGFGFFTKEQVVVHWGNVDLSLANFTSWSASRIEFLSPPGSGLISVTVETPQGVSNARTFEYKSDGPVPIVFNLGPTTGVSEATAGRWSPDGRLFVASRNGTLHALTYNDDYSLQSSALYGGVSALANREILGLAFDPFAPPGNPRLYVAHTQTYAQGGSSFVGAAPYPATISRLDGPNFDAPVTVVGKLPTSNHDHGVNAMEFDDNGDLLVSVAGNTNAGVKHPLIGDLPESPLSGAIVKVELTQPGFNGALTYLQSSDGAVNDDQVAGELVDLAPGTHVSVWASGLRNVFDMTLTTWGGLYGADNGPNNGLGLSSTSLTSQSANHASDVDELVLLEYGHYYGHPNRNRGRYDPIQAVYFGTGAAQVPGFTQALTPLPSSSNGVVEYRSANFGSAMRGDLLALRFNTQLTRIQLNPDKRSIKAVSTLPAWIGGLNLVTAPGGALISIDYQGGNIKTFLPQESVTGLAVYDIQPWRAPAGGGRPFVIGGAGFGSMADTSVSIGGTYAALTSVSPTRIRGILPPSTTGGATGLLDVVVQVGAVSQALGGAYRYMPPSSAQANGIWSVHNAMPLPLGEVACTAIAGKLFVVGEGSTKSLAYDFATKSWSDSLAVRPFAGHHHASETYHGKWYLVGGLDAGQGKVQVYDPVANSWSLGADMPWAGGSVSTCRIGGRIYASGGIVGSSTVDNCAFYDIALDAWTPLASMPAGKGRNHAAAGTDGQRFWIFGGRGVGSGAGNFVANGFDDVQVYDPASNTWSASFQGGSHLKPLPIGRGGTGRTVFYQGEFYVFGGETLTGAGATSGNVYDRVDVYDPQTHTWRLETKMPTARHGVSPVIWQGAIHLAGGGVVAGFSSSSVYESFRR